jgi:hypothetical protein
LEVDVQQGNFKILQLLPQVLILFLVEKWISPSRSKTIEIGQKIEEILGVKRDDFIWNPNSLFYCVNNCCSFRYSMAF